VSFSHSGPRLSAVAAFAAAAGFLWLPAGAASETAPRYRPTRDAVILELPAGMPRVAAAEPTDADSVAARAAAFTALARKTRDARWFGRAEALVDPWLARPEATPRILVIGADLAQQRHEFTRARGLLDRAVAEDPRDPGARIQRANVALLLGDPTAARADCVAAIRSAAALPGTICLASSMTGTGSVARARRLLAPLGNTAAAVPAMAQWLMLTESDLALRDGDREAATGYLIRALALAPDHEETRARLAELWIRSGEAARALPLTQGSNPSAALLVVRIRAAEGIDPAQASLARRDLDGLLALTRRRGAGQHLREEAALALYVDRDAVRALELARKNFGQQKDTPDLHLLADAAIAAGDRQALAELRAWLARTGFEDRVTAARLARAGA
jgi:hypothetical protein